MGTWLAKWHHHTYFLQNDLPAVFSTFGSSSHDKIISSNNPRTTGKRTHVPVRSEISPTTNGTTAPPEEPIEVMINNDCDNIFLGRILGCDTRAIIKG